MFIVEGQCKYTLLGEKGTYRLSNGKCIEYEIWRKPVVNSRQKGAAFERSLANRLKNEYGYDCRRGQQYCGANGDADVVGLPFIHIEAKAVEKLNIHDAMSQSKHDAKDGEIPVVIHKKKYCETLVTMELPDFMKIYRDFEVSQEPITETEHRIYQMFCDGCMSEKKCHDTCSHCDMVSAIYAWEGI